MADLEAHKKGVQEIPDDDPIKTFFTKFLSESLSDSEKCKVMLPRFEELYEKWPKYEVETEE